MSKSTSLVQFSHTWVSALLGSVTDTLIYNWDCDDAKHFP